MTPEITRKLKVLVEKPDYGEYVEGFKMLRQLCYELLSIEADPIQAAGLRGEIKAYNLLIELPLAADRKRAAEEEAMLKRKKAEEAFNERHKQVEPVYVARN